ncbi:MAG: DUF1810 domain-containing protein [Mycobacterium sp.]|nr:DUF1810 domain-containing protein [Mycobacterium sp.]
MVPDPYSLQRFVDAQSGVYPEVTRELGRGRKTSHWMWFIFPQLTGLGRTATAAHFGITSLAEARAYLDHPVLGPRLRECALLLRDSPDAGPITLILGATDALKLRSSMTLFGQAGDDADRQLFQAVLDRFYGGVPCERTLTMIGE